MTRTGRRTLLKVDADEEGIGGDEAADACRYLVATKERELRLRKVEWAVRRRRSYSALAGCGALGF